MRHYTSVISPGGGDTVTKLANVATQLKTIAEIMFAMWILNGGDDWKLDVGSKLEKTVDAISRNGYRFYSSKDGAGAGAGAAPVRRRR